jgi:hypothetical protein
MLRPPAKTRLMPTASPANSQSVDCKSSLRFRVRKIPNVAVLTGGGLDSEQDSPQTRRKSCVRSKLARITRHKPGLHLRAHRIHWILSFPAEVEYADGGAFFLDEADDASSRFGWARQEPVV